MAWSLQYSIGAPSKPGLGLAKEEMGRTLVNFTFENFEDHNEVSLESPMFLYVSFIEQKSVRSHYEKR